jgi:UDP-N-acetylglucosamine--N-acetylmuramyl-(pentapeptide) pyrophosphoryl-undecaprenol N-acetylglucosamine transferase
LKLLYIGSRGGMEKAMVAKINVPYKGIFCGKLRRYFSLRNFFDFFKTPIGIIQAFFILLMFKPNVVFCKGGYVSFPVSFGAWLARKKVILHESDLVPGLANRLSAKFASKILVSFDETQKYFHKKDVINTGNPVRKWLNTGNSEEAKKITNLTGSLPVILFMGGSQGADFINNLVWKNLKKLTAEFQIIHICGAKKAMAVKEDRYFCTEFAGEELKHYYALADLVVSRAGANTLAEIEYIKKPSILIPIGLNASRGDQIGNANVFTQNHPAKIHHEKDFNFDAFIGDLRDLFREDTKKVWHSSHISATDKIADIIMESA